jgi:hypothetical protein
VRARLVVMAVVVAIVASAPVASGAASFVQRCNGPPPSTQSGRASFVPGVNGLSIAQTISVKVSLFDCSPNRATRGAGTVQSTIKPKGRQTCGTFFNTPTTWKSTAKVVWKDEKTSTLSVTYSLTGKTHFINIKGKVTTGLFKGHALTAQLKYKLVVAPIASYPHGDGVAQACANKLKPGNRNRVEISAIDVYTTKRFVFP